MEKSRLIGIEPLRGSGRPLLHSTSHNERLATGLSQGLKKSLRLLILVLAAPVTAAIVYYLLSRS